MQVDLRILRFDPERDAAPHWERYAVEAEPMDRVLSLLHAVKAEQDGTLTFRRSCGHGICGSDAMLINDRNRLACKIRVDQLGQEDQRRPAGRPAGRQGPRRRHGGLLRQVPQRHALPGERVGGPGPRAPPERRPTGRATTTRRSASCARPARPRALRSGRSPRTSGRLPSSTPTASSSTPATRPPATASRSWPTRTGSGAAGRLQLRGRLPARNQHHPRHPRGLAGDVERSV